MFKVRMKQFFSFFSFLHTGPSCSEGGLYNSDIHWLNLNPVDSPVRFGNTCLQDSDLIYTGQCYLLYEQPCPDGEELQSPGIDDPFAQQPTQCTNDFGFKIHK